MCLKLQACAFEYPLRGDVRAKWPGKYAVYIKMLEPIFDHLPDCSPHDLATPIRLGQPVAHLGIHAVDVRLRVDADAADGLAVHLNGEDAVRVVLGGHRNKSPAGLLGIGMGECVGEVLGDVPVIGMMDEAVEVVETPRSEFEILHGWSFWITQPVVLRNHSQQARILFFSDND